MRKLLYILAVFSALAFTGIEYTTKSLSVSVEDDSVVSISGTTNVNSFTCNYNVLKLENPIPVSYESREQTIVFASTFLELENQCFDCGHKAINKDFNKLLKTEIYPKIQLNLKQINKDSKQKDVLTALVEIHIANKKNTYKVPVKADGNKNLMVQGELELNLPDFNLEAPKKALGLIVVHNEIKVNFKLHLKQI